MKHLKIILFLSLAIMSTQTIIAYDFMVNGLCYHINGSQSVTVTYQNNSSPRYSNLSGALNIPASVTYNGTTFSVTAIDYCAFEGCKRLTSVTVPSSISTISETAFYNCSKLKSLLLQDGEITLLWKRESGINSNSYNTTFNCPLETLYIGRNVYYYCNQQMATGSYYHSSPFSKASLKSLIIGNCVTSIRDCAFNNCSGLTSATIPNSVTSIGNHAFYGCSGLTSVTIPNSVTSIGEEAFRNCTGLTSVTIGNSVTSIGENAFYYCSGLKRLTWNAVNCASNGNMPTSNIEQVTIGNEVEYLPDSFVTGSKITQVNLPNTLKSISNSAFYCCSNLTSVTIPNSVTSIGSRAFDDCTELKYLKLNDGANPITITSSSSSTPFSNCPLDTLYLGRNITYNSSYLPFKGKTTIKNLTIGNSVTEIGDYAFYNCYGLTSVTIGNNLKKIGESAFKYCSGLTSVTIPNSVTSIGTSAFTSCNSLEEVTINSNAILSKSYSSSSNIENLFGTQVKQYIIGNSVTSIGNYAFYNCYNMISVSIGNSVISIGNEAFKGCSGLTALTWNAVYCTTMGNMPTSKIKQVTIGNEVKYLPENFVKKSKITQINLPNTLKYINSSAFSDCTGLTSVTIPNSVTTIGEGAFYNCSGLTRVNISDIAAWCNISFGSYSSNPIYYAHLYLNGNKVTNLVIPNGVSGVKNYAFYKCTGLTSVTIPNSVTSIGESAFKYCSGLTSVIIGNSVTSIGNHAFYGCRGLTSATIPNSVTEIGSSAFEGCTGLASVTIPNSVTKIGEEAFYYCSGLTSVTIGNSVTSIGENAFSFCTGLTSVIIGNSVTSIGEYAFHFFCTGLTSIYSLNPIPPEIGSYTFSETNYASATLYVPIGSKESYKNAPNWKNFYNIIEKEYDGIDNVVIDPPVNPLENPDEIKSIYTIDGRSLNPQDISWLPNGLYIINGKKVLIKR